MAYVISNNLVGAQPIAETSTTQKHPLGTIVKAFDPTYGGGEFVYLKGVASTAVGSLVTYTASGVTALAPVGNAIPRPVAVAMSANVANQFGWYQVSGLAVATKLATVSLAAGVAVAIATIGRVVKTASGKEIQGALVAAVASAATGRTTVQLVIQRPTMQGRIT